MAVTTEHFHNGNGSLTTFAYTFPYYKTSDIKVKVGGTLKTESTHYNVTGTNIVFTSGNVPPNGTGNVHIYRETDVDTSKATFAAGSSIRATDLNNNETQLLYHAQEQNFNKIQTTDIEDGGITSAKILDGTIATADIADNAITSAKLATNSISAGNLAANSVGSSELANNAVTEAKIANQAVTNGKIGNLAVDVGQLANNAVTEAKIANGAVTNAKLGSGAVDVGQLADDSVTTAKIVADAVRTVHILDANVTTAKIANNSVTVDKVATNAVTEAKIANAAVTNAKIGNLAVDTGQLANNSVTDAKLAPGAIGNDKIASGSISTDKLANTAVTEAKIANQAVTSQKLDTNIDIAGALDVTGNATFDSAVQIKADNQSFYIRNASNEAKFNVDTDNGNTVIQGTLTVIGDTTLANNSIGTAEIATNAITSNELGADTVTEAKIADNAVTTAKIADAELTTLAGMQSGTASILASSTALTSTTAELNLLDGKSVVTTVSGSSTDVQLPTAKAVNDAVAALNIDNGNFVPINDDQSFPNANPDPGDNAGTIVSIADAGGLVVNGSGVSTTGRTLGGSTVTINGIDSSLNNTTIAAGKGMLVQTTSTLNTYDYHRLTLDEAGVASAQTLVSDFNQRYRIGSSNPTSSLDDGDLFFNTTSNKMLVYNASDTSWDDVQSVGNYFINTISSYSGTGGNSATFNGSAYRFVLSNAGTYAQQHLVSVNGVIQKPNSGTSQPSEGFAIDGSSILFSTAPASGSDYFIVTIGASVNIGTPGNNTVSTATLQNLAVTTAKIAADAVDGTKIADDAVGAEHIEDLDADVKWVDSAKAKFGTGNDLEIWHNGSASYITDVGTGDLMIGTNSAIRLRDNTGNVDLAKFTNGGAVELYYDNAKKLETTSTGATVSGDDLLLSGGGHSKLKLLTTGTGHATGIQITHASGAGAQQIWQLQTDGTADGDLKLRNATSGTDIFYVQPDNNVRFQDSRKLLFGTGSDLQIYHDGSHNRIDSSNGNIYLRHGTDNAIKTVPNGAVELYYDDSKKLETLSNGVKIIGDITNNSNNSGVIGASDSVWADIYSNAYHTPDGGKYLAGTGSDLQIYHDGTDNIILSNGASCDLLVYVANGELAIKAVANGSVELYHNNVEKLSTTSVGISVTGDIALSSHLDMEDDKIIKLGTGDDLQIYHGGGNSTIKNVSGGGVLTLKNEDNAKLQLMTQNSYPVEIKTNAENAVICNANGAVELYYDNSKKFETTNSGVKAHGQFVITDSNYYIKLDDNVKFKSGNGNDIEIYHDGTNSAITNATGDLYIQGNGDDLILQAGDDILLQPQSSENGALIKGNGAVELYYDNSKKFETLSNGAKVYGNLELLDSGADVRIKNDNGKCVWGADDDMYIYYNSSDDLNYIYSNNKNLHVCANGSNIEIRPVNAELSARFLPNSAAELYYDGTKKFQTEGGNNAARIYGNTIIRSAADNMDIATFTDDGSTRQCNLYYNGAKKFETRGYGAQVLGILSIDGASSHAVQTYTDASAGTSVFAYRAHVTSSDTVSLNIWNNGNVENTNNSYGQISDANLKENIVDAKSQWDDIKAVKVRNFNFKASTGYETNTQIGVVAQELETVSSGLVYESGGGDDKTKAVKSSVLYMKALKALQEAMAKIETLETKVAALEAK